VGSAAGKLSPIFKRRLTLRKKRVLEKTK